MSTTAWRWFPHCLFLAMAAVFAVNGAFVYIAVNHFPGAAGRDGFDLSNEYDHVLATAAKQAALGWRIDTAIDGQRRPLLLIADRTGAPLNALIEAQAERPVGPASVTPLRFHVVAPGRYQADTTLFSGQWDLLVTIRVGAALQTTTRRLAAP